MTPSAHAWNFVPTGGLDQVTLGTADDLRSLKGLDQKLWVALSCPVKGLEIAERTLSLIDSDGDGHVRPPEVIAAVEWACARLRDPSLLIKGAEALPVDAIAAGPEGQALADSARWILSRLASPGPAVTAEQAVEVAKSVSQGALKGDGSIRPEAAADADTASLVRDIAACKGRVTTETVSSFYADLAAIKAWHEAGVNAGASGFGDGAAEAFAAAEAVRSKVSDYFARTELASFDPKGVGGLNLNDEDFRRIAGSNLDDSSPSLAALPLARIEPARPLPLADGVNPAWAAALARLRQVAVAPLFGAAKASLTKAEWLSLSERLKPYESWVSAKPACPAASLGIARIEALLGGLGRGGLESLFKDDRELAPRVAALADVERLALLVRDLGRLLRNFVNFSDFYSKAKPAVFQAGTLYLDSRSCRLCIRVDDIASHASFAIMSRVYVVYVECRRPGSEPMKIAAAVTQGDSDYLFVGRNGVFYDRRGRDWDATVVKIVESPISLRQAFWAPYKKAASLVGDIFAKFASSKEKVVNASVDKAVNATASQMAQAVQQTPPPPPPPFDIGKFAGIFAAVGLALASIGTAIASVFEFFHTANAWEKPLLIVLLMLVISGPSVLIAFLRLRQRTLGPLLEGTGWAVNGRVKINVPLGAALTDRGVLPPDSKRLAFDPYADNAARNRTYATLAVILAIAAWLALARLANRWPF